MSSVFYSISNLAIGIQYFYPYSYSQVFSATVFFINTLAEKFLFGSRFSPHIGHYWNSIFLQYFSHQSLFFEIYPLPFSINLSTSFRVLSSHESFHLEEWLVYLLIHSPFIYIFVNFQPVFYFTFNKLIVNDEVRVLLTTVFLSTRVFSPSK